MESNDINSKWDDVKPVSQPRYKTEENNSINIDDYISDLRKWSKDFPQEKVFLEPSISIIDPKSSFTESILKDPLYQLDLNLSPYGCKKRIPAKPVACNFETSETLGPSFIGGNSICNFDLSVVEDKIRDDTKATVVENAALKNAMLEIEADIKELEDFLKS